MKAKAVICIVILILALVSTGVGCNSAKGGEAVDMMKKVPMGSDAFQFVDIDAFRTDADLEDVYIDLESGLAELTDYAGINFDELDRVAFDEISNMLLEGDFDLEKVRGNLVEFDLDSDEYNGIELWGDGSIALVSNKLVIFSFSGQDVKDYVNVIKGVDASLYDDKDFRDVIERLPHGIIMIFMEGVFPINYGEYDGLKVAGVSAVKMDKHSMVVTGVGKFETRDAASDVMDKIEDDLENDEFADWKNIDIKQDGEFITVTTELDIEEMFD